MVSIEQARAAKEKVKTACHELVGFMGVGVTRVDGEYAVVVNLSNEPGTGIILEAMDGVRVVWKVVGSMSKQVRP